MGLHMIVQGLQWDILDSSDWYVESRRAVSDHQVVRGSFYKEIKLRGPSRGLRQEPCRFESIRNIDSSSCCEVSLKG